MCKIAHNSTCLRFFESCHFFVKSFFLFLKKFIDSGKYLAVLKIPLPLSPHRILSLTSVDENFTLLLKILPMIARPFYHNMSIISCFLNFSVLFEIFNTRKRKNKIINQASTQPQTFPICNFKCYLWEEVLISLRNLLGLHPITGLRLKHFVLAKDCREMIERLRTLRGVAFSLFCWVFFHKPPESTSNLRNP